MLEGKVVWVCVCVKGKNLCFGERWGERDGERHGEKDGERHGERDGERDRNTGQGDIARVSEWVCERESGRGGVDFMFALSASTNP